MMKPIVLALAILLTSCRATSPPTWSGEVINCATDVVRECGPQILPRVNTCLANATGGDGWRGCMLGLIGPGMCTAETVIGCAVRHAAETAAGSARLNQHDEVSARAAARGRAWIVERGYRFAGDELAPAFGAGSAGGGGAQ